jgi:hypothetical protein
MLGPVAAVAILDVLAAILAFTGIIPDYGKVVQGVAVALGAAVMAAAAAGIVGLAAVAGNLARGRG